METIGEARGAGEGRGGEIRGATAMTDDSDPETWPWGEGATLNDGGKAPIRQRETPQIIGLQERTHTTNHLCHHHHQQQHHHH
eukprot:4741044-Pyramimonas_sp.AAC.1